MAIAKQIGVIGAFVVALVLSAPGTASAQAALRPGSSYKGRLVSIGDEPQAGGSWTATSYWVDGGGIHTTSWRWASDAFT